MPRSWKDGASSGPCRQEADFALHLPLSEPPNWVMDRKSHHSSALPRCGPFLLSITCIVLYYLEQVTCWPWRSLPCHPCDPCSIPPSTSPQKPVILRRCVHRWAISGRCSVRSMCQCWAIALRLVAIPYCRSVIKVFAIHGHLLCWLILLYRLLQKLLKFSILCCWLFPIFHSTVY